jgi:AcrR family transcriptional regulator
MTRKPPAGLRATPRQDRSRFSVEAILEAATQILESDGETGFNTNAIAARAGVSIGALYRYFPDKRAILFERNRPDLEKNPAKYAADSWYVGGLLVFGEAKPAR